MYCLRRKKPAGYYRKLIADTADLRKLKRTAPNAKWTAKTLFRVKVHPLSLTSNLFQ